MSTRLFEAKPFIIAEVGSNWQTLEHAIASISAAKQAGADAVKFQAFNANALYGQEKEMGHELPLEWLPSLKEKADACGIEFMCTAFSPELVAAVDPYVSVHKVASSDLSYPQLLEAVAKSGTPVLLSTGGARTMEEIEFAYRFLLSCGTPIGSVMLLYCVAAYPADFVDFDIMSEYDGFSDHTLGITAAVHAAQHGLKVIEKHFTAFPELDTPDRPHSATPEQFKRMVDAIRQKGYQPPNESAMSLRHNRRLIATRDIAAGETLTYGQNYGAYRSLEDDSRGLSPFAWRSLEGRAATRPITRGQGIGPGDFA